MFGARMNGSRPSNVIPMRPGHAGQAHERLPETTVLHAVADDDGLAEIAPVAAALTLRSGVRQLVVHGGASSRFADEGLAYVDRFLAIPDGTIAERTAAALTAFEAVLVRERPDIVVATGDDDVMVAAAMAAVKLRIAVAHLASGLRCWDWQLPDEVNRTVIDRLSDTLFTFSADAVANLRDEGVPAGRIHLVGNTRIDTLHRHEPAARSRAAWQDLDLVEHAYTLVALQRPDSVATSERLERLAAALRTLGAAGAVVLLEHPRT